MSLYTMKKRILALRRSQDYGTFRRKFIPAFRCFENKVIRRSIFFSQHEEELIDNANVACKGHHSAYPRLHFDSALADLVKNTKFRKELHTERDRSSTHEELLVRVEGFKKAASTPYVRKISDGALEDISFGSFLVFRKLRLQDFHGKVLTIKEAVQNLHGRSSAGFGYWTRKSKVIGKILNDAFSFVQSNSFGWLSFPMTAGFRIQQRPRNYDDPHSPVDVKERLFMCYSGVITLFEELFHPLMWYLASINSPYITGKVGAQVSTQLRSAFRRGKGTLLGADIEGYDRSIRNEYIIAAFVIIWMAFDWMPSFYKNILNNLCAYFCVSVVWGYYKLTGHFTFIKYSGVPSGSVFTNLIDTLVHMLVVYISDPLLFLLDTLFFCGDDVIMRHYNKDFKLNDLTKLYSSHGLKVSLEKSDVFKDSSYFHFLGHNWYNFDRYVHLRLAINNMVWHDQFEVELSEFDRLISRSASICANGRNGYYIFSTVFPDHVARIDTSHQVLLYKDKVGLLPFSSGLATIKARFVQMSLLKVLRNGYKIC